MIEKTIEDFEARIRNATTLSPVQKQELQTLVDNLKAEVQVLEQANLPEPGLRQAVQHFETAHPQLTMTANSIATYFANLGI